MKTSVAALASCLLLCLPLAAAADPLTLTRNNRMNALEARVTVAENQLMLLKQGITGKQVAFGASSGHSGSIGPFNTPIILIFRNVNANTGAYNPGTGIFTAPVKGVYYFSFSGHNRSIKPMGLQLMKNGMRVVTVYNHAAGNRYETATNGMTLQLEAGDQVYISLMVNTWAFDNLSLHTTFVGFLLFPQ